MTDHCACQRRFSSSLHMDVNVLHRVVSGQGTRSFVPIVFQLVVHFLYEYANTTWVAVCQRSYILLMCSICAVIMFSVRCVLLTGHVC